MLVDANIYVDGKERRTLDLRPDGVACIPLLGLSNFQSVRTGEFSQLAGWVWLRIMV